MKPFLDDYAVVNPETEREVAEVLAEEDDVVILAGGTDLMVSLKHGELDPCTILNLQSCSELNGGPSLEDGLKLNALTTFRDVRYNDEVTNHYPLLKQASRNLSVLAVQSRATWAGNVVNASPCANGAAALMAYDATLVLSGVEGTREVELTDFYGGYKDLLMEEDEFLREIRLPEIEPGWNEYYRDVGPREYQSISKTLLAGRIRTGSGARVDNVRLVAGSVAPHTLKLSETEEVLRGEELTESLIEDAASALQEEIQPVDDVRSNRKYRRRVTENMLREFLRDNLPI